MDVSGGGKKAARKINAAVISMGGAGRAHAQRILRNPRSKLFAVFDINEKMLSDYKWLQYEGGHTTTDYEQILNDERIEMVPICSPDNTHFDYAIRAIDAGKHVLIEKPMVTTLRQCEELSRAIEGNGKNLGVHHQMRYVPCYRKAKAVLDSGRLGAPLVIEADYVHDMRERASRFDSWRLNEKAPQEVILGASSHAIDLIRWMANEEVDEVFSYASHVGWEEYPTFDTVVSLLRFKGNTIGKVMSTIACKRTQLNTLRIYGVGGSIIDNLLINEKGLKEVIHEPSYNLSKAFLFQKAFVGPLMKSKSVQNYPLSVYEHEKACEELINEFIECIIEGRKFPIDFYEGAYTIQICLACSESYEAGKAVKLRRSFKE